MEDYGWIRYSSNRMWYSELVTYNTAMGLRSGYTFETPNDILCPGGVLRRRVHDMIR